MSDRPILFQGPMVCAHRAGRKTQTRRILDPQPTECEVDRFKCTGTVVKNGYSAWESWCGDQPANAFKVDEHGVTCLIDVPYAVGDRLWVRETISFERKWTGTKPKDVPAGEPCWYWADGNPTEGDWTKPIVSIHMPRVYSRLTDIVTDVRLQRLQDISSGDALAEGVEMESADPPFFYVPGIWPHARTAVGIEEPGGRHAERSYGKLWDEINGAGSWDTNPWVAVVTFTVEQKNIDT